MSKRRLDDVQWRAFVRQLEREAMPKTVSMNSLGYSSLAGQAGEQHSDIRRLHWRPGKRAEDSRSRAETKPRPAFKPGLHNSPAAGVQSHEACGLALTTEYSNCPGLGIEVFGQQAQRFSDSQTRAIEDDEQGPISDSRWCSLGASVEDGAGLIRRKWFSGELQTAI